MHYLRTVLRLQPGAEFLGFTAGGEEYVVRLVQHEGRLSGEVVEVLPPRPRAGLTLTLYQGLPRGKRLPLIVQKCTELGLARLVPVVTVRSQVKIDPREAEGKRSRWQKIATEATEQSLGGAPLEVAPAVGWAGALLDWRQREEPGLLLDETLAGEVACGLRQALVGLQHPARLSLFVGPEGGFSPREASAARVAGLQPISLGPRILRTETAAIVICALTMYEYGELG